MQQSAANASYYSKDESNFVIVHFAPKRDDGSDFSAGIQTIANLPEGFRPDKRAINCASVIFNTSTPSQYAILAAVHETGQVVLHIPEGLHANTVAGTLCFYTN